MESTLGSPGQAALRTAIGAQVGLSSANDEKLLSVWGDSSAQSALLSLLELSPTSEELDTLAALDEAALSPTELSQVSALDAQGVGAEDVEAVDAMAQAGIAPDQLAAATSKPADALAGGASLPYQGEMEAMFGEDLSGVKVSLRAKEVLDSLQAHAATDGESIAFSTANPSKDDVIHEVAHIVQYRRNGKGTGISTPEQAGEREAEQIAAQAKQGEPLEVTEACPGEVSRKPWYSHVGDFFSGVGSSAWDMGKGAVSMAWGTFKLVNPIVWVVAPQETAKTWEHLKNTTRAIWSNPMLLWDAVTEPIVKDWNEGRPWSAVGRVVFELAGLLVGAKGVDKLAKGSKLGTLGSKGDELVKIGNTVEDASKLGKVEDASKIGKVEDASKVSKGDDASKLDDAGKGTSSSTTQHVHEGGTVTNPQSPYLGKWDGKGIHSWDGLVKRCQADGYTIKKVTHDPKTGVRRVEIQKKGVDPRTGDTVSGTIKKTIYPKKYTQKQVDDLGENAFQAAQQSDSKTKFELPGHNGKMKKDGTPADGYFEATVSGPDGAQITLQGWFKQSSPGKYEITSHAPRFSKDWPDLPSGQW